MTTAAEAAEAAEAVKAVKAVGAVGAVPTWGPVAAVGEARSRRALPVR